MGIMKIAITGAKGMIGRALVKKLSAKGNKVIECDRENCDVLDPGQLRKAFNGAEVVVHLAAALEEGADDIHEVNVKGTENSLETSAENKVRQFIFLSTVGVYGNSPGMKDENSPLNPQTEYEKSKAEAEKKVLSYQEVFHVTILRPALVVGDNKYWRGIIKTISKGFPLIGSGKNSFQLLCLQDLVEAIRFCIDREECYGETFIVAEKEASTLGGIVDHIRKELGMKGATPKVPRFMGNALVAANSLLEFNPLLKKSYVERLAHERLYSTKKLEALGWKHLHSAKECISRLVKDSRQSA